MNFHIVIPARLASTRLPGKPLADIGGKKMIERVYDQACKSSATSVVVATDHQDIIDEVKRFGGNAVMTDADHPSGTDRLAEVAYIMQWTDDEILVNVQGDEPLIPPSVIDQVANNLAENSQCDCSTLCEPIKTSEEFFNPSAVKVVKNDVGEALYFSRAPVPWPRDSADSLQRSQSIALPADIPAMRHIGIYAYKVGLLRQFTQWPVSSLEQIESLEQLRIMAQGKRIHVDVACAEVPGGVDTPDDLERVRSLVLG